MTDTELINAQEKFNALPPRAYKREQVCPHCENGIIYSSATSIAGNGVSATTCRCCNGTGVISVGLKPKRTI